MDRLLPSRGGICHLVAWAVGLLRYVGLVRVSEWLSDRISSFGDRFTEWGVPFVAWVVRDWWISIPITLFILIWFGIWLAQGLSLPALKRVRGAFGEAVVDTDSPEPVGTTAPEPLPVGLHDVRYRYPNATNDALVDVTLDIAPAELVAVVGANGSGKSTLSRLLVGRRAPSDGTIERPGAVGLGRVGGTAIVAQRPEAQVLGVRVRDDVVWGIAEPELVDVDAFLRRVGLEEFADRETSTLSGGELQRLAIAAALAREPKFFVSDESTAMVDGEGRELIVALLRDLADDDGLGVVHVTHRAAEAEAADRTITLDGGRVVVAPARLRTDTPVKAARDQTSIRLGAPLIVLENVGHVYARNTPWANRALTGVDLVVRDGESILVVGHNGSGKSTLAWILAGLLDPSEGTATLEDKPITQQVGRVGLSFQHARLQLLRPTVLDEVCTAGGVDQFAARAALELVGLDPASFGQRRVDELSGGQMRRVVLAGVIAAKPRAIILDEPFAGLDANGRAEFDDLLTDLRRRRDIALVIVSHDRDLPDGLVDRVVELEAGRITRDEPLEDALPEVQP